MKNTSQFNEDQVFSDLLTAYLQKDFSTCRRLFIEAFENLPPEEIDPTFLKNRKTALGMLELFELTGLDQIQEGSVKAFYDRMGAYIVRDFEEFCAKTPGLCLFRVIDGGRA